MIAPDRDELLLLLNGRDPRLGARIAPRLSADGLELLEVTDTDAALRCIDRRPPAVIAVQVTGEVGPLTLRVLRDHRPATPVLALLPSSSDESDRLLAFELGADDVMVEPVSTLEFAARVRALRRRASYTEQRSFYRSGPLEVDLHAREVRLRGLSLALPPQEFNLLAFLVRHPRRAFSRRELLEEAWDQDRGVHDRSTVTEHVRRLRRRFDELGEPGQRWITTVHGVGYRFDPQPEQEPVR